MVNILHAVNPIRLHVSLFKNVCTWSTSGMDNLVWSIWYNRSSGECAWKYVWRNVGLRVPWRAGNDIQTIRRNSNDVSICGWTVSLLRSSGTGSITRVFWFEIHMHSAQIKISATYLTVNMLRKTEQRISLYKRVQRWCLQKTAYQPAERSTSAGRALFLGSHRWIYSRWRSARYTPEMLSVPLVTK